MQNLGGISSCVLLKLKNLEVAQCLKFITFLLETSTLEDCPIFIGCPFRAQTCVFFFFFLLFLLYQFNFFGEGGFDGLLTL
jgi:hypothetical protein